MFWTVSEDRNRKMELFCSTPRRHHFNQRWKRGHSCRDMYVQFKPSLNLSFGGWCFPFQVPGLTRSHCLHGPEDALYAKPCLQERMRLRCSLQLCALLPPPGNVREANILFWEEAEFLVVQKTDVSNRLSSTKSRNRPIMRHCLMLAGRSAEARFFGIFLRTEINLFSLGSDKLQARS